MRLAYCIDTRDLKKVALRWLWRMAAIVEAMIKVVVAVIEVTVVIAVASEQ